MKKFISFLMVMIMAVTLSLPAFAADLPADVSSTHWAAEAVEMLTNLGILTGYTDNTFRGQQNITRYEIAVALQRLINYIESSGQTEALVTVLESSDINMSDLVKELNTILDEYASADDFVALEKRVTALESNNKTSAPTTTVSSSEVAALKSELNTLQENYNVAVRDLVALNERLARLEGQQNVASSSSVSAVEVQPSTNQTTTSGSTKTNQTSTSNTTTGSTSTSKTTTGSTSTSNATTGSTSTGKTTTSSTKSTTAQTVSGKSIGLRENLFDSNSMTVDALVVPTDVIDTLVGKYHGSPVNDTVINNGIFALSTINYRANSDLYITLKGALRKNFTFTSPLGTSALLSATYLANDKLAFNFRLSDLGEVNILGEYLIINNDKFDFAAQLGLGYTKIDINGFYVGLDLLASYDILSNLNLSANLGVDFDLDSESFLIEDEISVKYAPIQYANLYLSYGRKDRIYINSSNSLSDVLTFGVGTGIKDEYFAKEDYFDEKAKLEENFSEAKVYDNVLNPGKYHNNIALTNNLSLNYNVLLTVSNLLDGVSGNQIKDSLKITAGVGYAIAKFDASFFAGAYLKDLFDGYSGVGTDMQLALGLGYQINNSLKASLNIGTYLRDLSNVNAFLYISPSATYVVNNNMNIKLSYIADFDFARNEFGSVIGIGAEVKF